MKQKSFSRFLCIAVLFALLFSAALPAYTQMGTVTAANDGPYTANEDDGVLPAETLVVPAGLNSLLANDIDSEDDDLVVDNWTPPSCGGLFVPCGTLFNVNTATGAFNYTPPTGFSGVVTFTYTATDNNGGFDSALVTIIVQPTDANDAPEITPATQQVSTPPGTPFTFSNFNVRDIDAADEALNVDISVPAGEGTFALGTACGTGDVDGSDGILNFNGDLGCINLALNTLQFTPDAALLAGDTTTITITVNDLGNSGTGGQLSDTATVTVLIAGIIVDPLDGVLVEEGSTDTDTYQINLESVPTQTVRINIMPDQNCLINDPLTIADDFVDLTVANGTAPVTVTVSANNDLLSEGDHTCLIQHAVDASSDPGYIGMPVDSVIANVRDDDQVGLIIDAAGLSLDEGNSTASTYTVRLRSSPGQSVTVSVAITVQNNPDLECSITSTTPLTFTSADWFMPKDVSVVAIDDGQVEGGHDCRILHSSTASTSPNPYNNLNEELFVPVADNDNVSIVIAHNDGGSTVIGEEPPGGFTDEYTVRLGSLPQGDVTVNITPNEECTVDTPSILFNTGNWNSAVTVTVTAAPDTEIEGNHICQISHDAVSAVDAGYNDLPAVIFEVNVVDDDAGANDPPVANDDSYSTPQGTQLIVDPRGILENDTDDDMDTLTVVNASSIIPSGAGTLLVNTDGSFTFTPDGAFMGPSASFTYQAFDGTVNSNPATVTITITGPNQPPTANGQTVTTSQDTAITITLTGTDPEGSPLTFAIVANPINGVLSGLNPTTGVVTYTPNSGYTGPDSFTFTVNDGTNTSAEATVNITVSATANQTPTANPQTLSTAVDTPLPITLTGTDPEGNPLTFAIVANPTNGVLSGLNPATGAVTYTPNSGYTGPDSFTFTVNDGIVTSAAATISITVTPAVNQPPTANGQTVTTSQDTAITITLTGTDPEGSPLTFAIVANPTNGVLSGLNPATGAVTYTPNSGYTGPDSFTFTVNDGIATSAAATISITVTPAGANTAPVITNATPNLSGTLVVLDVTFTDNPGDTHTATIDWGDGSSSPGLVTGLTVQGSHDYGTNGSFTITINVIDQLGAIGTHSLILDVGTGEVRFPPPVALCMDQNFIADSTIRANVPDAIRHTVRCRPIVANGNYTNSPEEQAMSSANIGNLAVLQMGVLQAVDVFSPEGLVDLSGVTVCLRGSGTLLHLYGAPRTPHTVPTYPVAAFPGFTCGSIPQTGTLVLVNGSSTSGSGGGGSSPANTPVPPTPSDPGLRLNSFPECTAVAFGGVNVRSTPSERGALLGVLSPDTPMNLITRVGMWYVIDYQGQTGYVRMDLVAFACGG